MANKYLTGVKSLPSHCVLNAGLALSLLTLSYALANAQTAPKGATDPSGASGFSIETEMLTYRALESNSQAIACDVAAFLNGTAASFTGQAPGTICNIGAGTTKSLVILLPFDKTQFADLQLWRADMATMARLLNAADDLNCPPSAAKSGTSVAGSLLSMTPAGPPLALAQGTLALLASEQSSTSVGGTIQDQAFMNGVGRELRSLGVTVIMPSAYLPNSLSVLDEQHSPFLARRARLLEDLGCLAAQKVTTDARGQAVKQTADQIDSFLVSLGEATTPAKSDPTAGAASTQGKSSSGVPASASNTAPKTSTDAASGSTHLSSVLLADGLARQIGIDPATGDMDESAASQHVLLVKALESGGSVIKNTNVLGTKIRYSGGSVGTYALFTGEGALECSGNVYDYAGALNSKGFIQNLRNLKPDPAKQVIFRERCSVTSDQKERSGGVKY